MDDFVCNLKNVRPLTEWIHDEKDCPPCLVAPLAGYYLGTLEEAGETNLAEELKKTYEGGDTLTIIEKLDNIKDNVGDALLKQLRNLDCFAQSFKPD